MKGQQQPVGSSNILMAKLKFDLTLYKSLECVEVWIMILFISAIVTAISCIYKTDRFFSYFLFMNTFFDSSGKLHFEQILHAYTTAKRGKIEIIFSYTPSEMKYKRNVSDLRIIHAK